MAPGVCILKITKKKPGAGQRYTYGPLVVKDKSVPNGQRAYDPAEDCLYLDQKVWDDLKVLFFQLESDGSSSAPWIAEIRHIALEASEAESNGAYALALDLEYLPNLTSISFVFPVSSDTVNISEPVELSKEQQARPTLRKLSEKELKSMRVNADYSYDSWFASHVVEETATAAAYLESAYNNLKEEVMRRPTDRQPACWDAETRKLKLTFYGVCFVRRGSAATRAFRASASFVSSVFS